ncbi:MAG: hypothetical protein CL694_07210 [Chloroflexi bacterium]|nr:hypothetical protein [Chloroflexota bacterium]MDP6799723.1 ABC transporter substrate-binding protein [SAR202 cluster bacterium]
MSNDPTPLRLVETFHNLFYTPIYVAVTGGHFYAEGLNVHFSTVPEGGSAMEMLRSGAADVTQTGISRSLMELDAGRGDAPLHVAEINQRDGFFLLSRRPVEDWTWKRLEGATLAPVGFTPVPWTSLRSALIKNDVDPGRLTLVEGLSAEEALDLFRGERVDYIQMPHPQAQTLIEEGVGHLATALGPELGYICYSSFATMPEFIEARPDTIQRFVDGFNNALRWLAAADNIDILERVSPLFPNLPGSTLEAAIHQYRMQETWPSDPSIGEDGYTSMRDLMIEAGLVRGRHLYESVVRPEFALRAMKS